MLQAKREALVVATSVLFFTLTTHAHVLTGTDVGKGVTSLVAGIGGTNLPHVSITISRGVTEVNAGALAHFVHTGEGEGGSETLEAECILVAVGRKTVTEELNLDVTEVELNDDGTIPVDEYGQTAQDGVYAAGDVIGGYWLAHAAGHEGITAVEHMAGENPLPMDQTLVPRVRAAWRILA